VAFGVVYLRKKLCLKIDVWNVFTKPLIAGTSMVFPLVLANIFAYDFFSTKIGTIMIIALSGILYFVALILLKVFDGVLPQIKNKLKYRGKKHAKSYDTH